MRALPPSLRTLALMVLAATAIGCADITAPAALVSAAAVPAGITIANHGDARACYFALARSAMAYTDFVLSNCDAGTMNPVLAPGASVTVPWAALGAQPADSEFVVWWWTGKVAPPGSPWGTDPGGTILVTR